SAYMEKDGVNLRVFEIPAGEGFSVIGCISGRSNGTYEAFLGRDEAGEPGILAVDFGILGAWEAGWALFPAVGHRIFPVEIGEADAGGLEADFDAADGAVALLGDDDLGGVVFHVHLVLPLCMGGTVLIRLEAFEIIGLAVDEHDDVCVLFDGAGFTK